MFVGYLGHHSDAKFILIFISTLYKYLINVVHNCIMFNFQIVHLCKSSHPFIQFLRWAEWLLHYNLLFMIIFYEKISPNINSFWMIELHI